MWHFQHYMATASYNYAILLTSYWDCGWRNRHLGTLLPLLLCLVASRLKKPKIIVSKDLEGTVDLSSSITYCRLLALIARSSNIYCQPCAVSTYRFLYCLSPSDIYCFSIVYCLSSTAVNCAPFPNTYCSFF